jgi:hypothetical protein
LSWGALEPWTGGGEGRRKKSEEKEKESYFVSSAIPLLSPYNSIIFLFMNEIVISSNKCHY